MVSGVSYLILRHRLSALFHQRCSRPLLSVQLQRYGYLRRISTGLCALGRAQGDTEIHVFVEEIRVSRHLIIALANSGDTMVALCFTAGIAGGLL